MRTSPILDDIKDVRVTSPSNGQTLVYQNGTWTNQSTQPPPSALNDLTDVTITNATVGQQLQFNGTQWVNSDATESLPDRIVDGDTMLRVQNAGTSTLSIAGSPVIVSDIEKTHFVDNGGSSWVSRFVSTSVSPSDQSGASCTIDNQGNTIVAGYAETEGGLGIVIKYNNDGDVVWTKQIKNTDGSVNLTDATAVVVDSSDNIYVLCADSNAVSMVLKFTPTGTLVWQRKFGDVNAVHNVGGSYTNIALKNDTTLIVAGQSYETSQPSVVFISTANGSVTSSIDATIDQPYNWINCNGMAIDPLSDRIVVLFSFGYDLDNTETSCVLLLNGTSVEWTVAKRTSWVDSPVVATWFSDVVVSGDAVIVGGTHYQSPGNGHVMSMMKIDMNTGAVLQDVLLTPDFSGTNVSIDVTALDIDATDPSFVYMGGYVMHNNNAPLSNMFTMKVNIATLDVVWALQYDYASKVEGGWWNWGHSDLSIKNGMISRTGYTDLPIEA